MVDHTARTVGEGYALIGRHEEAVRWVRIAVGRSLVHYPYYDQHCPFLEGVRTDPSFEQLMSEVKPRWEALVAWERGLASVSS